MKKSFIFLADGFEEVEAVTTIDVLRRGGMNLVTTSVHEGRREVTGANGLTLAADTTLAEVEGEEAALLILPGGMPGAETLGNTPRLIEWLQAHADRDGWIAAICAAPAVVLSKLEIPRRLRLTCYPGFEPLLTPRHEVVDDGVAVDGKFITARGPGLAFGFGLEILARLRGAACARAISSAMLIN